MRKLPYNIQIAVCIDRRWFYVIIFTIILFVSQAAYWLGLLRWSRPFERFLMEEFGPTACWLVVAFMFLRICSFTLLRRNIPVGFINTNKDDEDVRSVMEQATSPVTWNDLVSVIQEKRVKSILLRQRSAVTGGEKN